MATRPGPHLPILTYDTALEAARVMRTDVADPIEARGVIAPLTGRIDSRTKAVVVVEENLAAGGVYDAADRWPPWSARRDRSARSDDRVRLRRAGPSPGEPASARAGLRSSRRAALSALRLASHLESRGWFRWPLWVRQSGA